MLLEFWKIHQKGLDQGKCQIKKGEKTHTNDLHSFYGTLIYYTLQFKYVSIHASVMGDDEERYTRIALNKSRHLL